MKLTEHESEGARRGRLALDAALISMGAKSSDENLDFLEAEPVVGVLPNLVLRKPGVAPFRFVFGQDLNIWVGPFSEVVLMSVFDHSERDIQHEIARLLRSSVTCERQRRHFRIALSDGPDVWLRLKVNASGAEDAPEAQYAPYIGK